MDEKTKHTPGPWSAVAVSGSGSRTNLRLYEPTRPADGIAIFAVSPGAPVGQRVGWVGADYIRDDNREACSPEAVANARVISAAPSLLAACEALIRGDDLQKAIDLARAALSQVEG